MYVLITMVLEADNLAPQLTPVKLIHGLSNGLVDWIIKRSTLNQIILLIHLYH